MKLVLAFFISLATGPVVSAAGAFDCAEYLDSVDGNQRTAPEVYVGLINYYLKQSTDEILKQSVLNQIIAARTPMNPFAHFKDQLSIQVSRPLERSASKLSANDWSSGVVPEIAKLAKQNASEGEVREQSKTETAALFAPKISYRGETTRVSSPPSEWQVIGGKTYVAYTVTSGQDNGTLYVYEVTGGKLSLVAESPVESVGQARPAWFVEGGRALLAFGNESLVIYQFSGHSLKKVAEKRTGSFLQDVSASWQRIEGRILLAAQVMGHVRIFELRDNELLDVARYQTDHVRRIKWTSINNEPTLIADGQNGFILLAFRGDELELVQEVKQETQSKIKGHGKRVSMLTHQGRELLAFVDQKVLRMFELKRLPDSTTEMFLETSRIEIPHVKTDEDSYTTLFQDGERIMIITASNGSGVSLHEYKNGALSFLSAISSSAVNFPLGNAMFVKPVVLISRLHKVIVISTFLRGFKFFAFDNDTMTEKLTLEIDKTNKEALPLWQDGELYLGFSVGQNQYLLRVLSKEKDQR